MESLLNQNTCKHNHITLGDIWVDAYNYVFFDCPDCGKEFSIMEMEQLGYQLFYPGSNGT